MRTVPLKLAECVTTLYKADGALNPILSAPVWIGARTEGLEAEGEIEMVDSTPSGAAYREREQLGESHRLSFERFWAINPSGAGPDRDYLLARGKYVMVVYWESKRYGHWQKRTYYGVTAEKVGIRSQGQAVFSQQQMFGARYYVPDEGRLLGGSGGTNPLTPSGATGTATSVGDEDCLLFTHLGVMKTGDYFLGDYQYNDRPLSVSWAKAVAKASQTTATVLGLEVAGVMTALTITLPVAALGTEVSAGQGGVGSFAVSPVVVVPMGSGMRWKVVSGPGTVNEMGYGAAVNMTVS